MLEIKLQQPFDLDFTLDSGQCFRWNKIGDWWYGIVNGNVWKCWIDNDILLVDVFNQPNSLSDNLLKRNIIHYFNLDKNYISILDSIRKDVTMEKVLKEFSGLRVLNQDPYETFLSYILTANNNVTRVKGMIERLSKNFGKKLETKDGDFFTFPSLTSLQSVSEEDFRQLGFGFRAKYFKFAVDELVGNAHGNSLLKFLQNSAVDKFVLTNFYGVGEKIADCTRVYSLEKNEVVPVDVWIRRILTNIYNLSEKMKYSEIQDFAVNYYGDYAGWAQLFLFVAGRQRII
jgi:N-glycosylase/DNA lyase